MSNGHTLFDLQASVQDSSAFGSINDYFALCRAYLMLISESPPTRIISPTDHRYIFYQYDGNHAHKITRPLNTDLFLESTASLQNTFERFVDFLADLKLHQQHIVELPYITSYLDSSEINQVIYTIQQSIGCIGDSFDNPNQSRKRIGQLFENFVRLLIQEVGLICESRTIQLPLPDTPDQSMSYELDLVFSRERALITSETHHIYPSEIVGSVKTTSKDRIDKIFLDKFMIRRLLGRDIPVVAIFLHDVQRARKGTSIFGINSTFKRNHFLGYTFSLNRLDGVYYGDPRPEMVADKLLSKYIFGFQDFLVRDLWVL